MIINKDELVKKLPFWNMLNNEEAELVKMSATINKYPKGVVAQGFEDECLGVIQVLKGQLRVYLLSEEGREVTLFRINEGEFCTLTASCIIEQITFETQISAEADTELVINAGTYERLADSNLQVKMLYL